VTAPVIVGCDDSVLMGHGPHNPKEDAQMTDATSQHASPTSTPLTTAIAVLLDETGSMESCRDAAIEGFNAWLTEQKRTPGTAGAPPTPTTLTLVKFSDRPDLPMCRLVCEDAPLDDVRPLNRETYTPEGGTPLLDAVGRTIMWMDRLQPKPARVLVVILTDGEENASREFKPAQIQDLIRAHEATGCWTFAYLGANQDAWAVGEALGIAPGNRASFKVGETHQAFQRVSKATKRFRLSGDASGAAFWEAGDQAPAPGPAQQPTQKPAPKATPRSPRGPSANPAA